MTYAHIASEACSILRPWSSDCGHRRQNDPAVVMLMGEPRSDDFRDIQQRAKDFEP
jgi:hypothetical protein